MKKLNEKHINQQHQERLKSRIEDVTFSIIDLETTGASWRKEDKIVEIACVQIKNCQIDYNSIYETLVNPQRVIPENVIQIHGITNEMVEYSPTVESVMPNFLSHINETVFVAHNANFDYGFIKHESDYYNLTVNTICTIDTVNTARNVFKHKDSKPAKYNLDELIRFFSINTSNIEGTRHRALYDAICAARVLEICIQETLHSGKSTLLDLYELSTNSV